MGPEINRLLNSPPTILVATPGRLNDHLTNNGIDRLCESLRILVFDEADQLLEMGFRPDIERALQRLPPKSTRQTLLYSATFATNVRDVVGWGSTTPNSCNLSRSPSSPVARWDCEVWVLRVRVRVRVRVIEIV